MDIRIAEAGDSNDILAWRNDPLTCAMSLSAGTVGRDEHDRWFESSLRNPLRMLYIGISGGSKVGVCRFDYDPRTDSAEVSINLNPAMRGRGLAVPLLTTSIATYRTTRPCTLIATIKNDNAASLRSFGKAGFILDSRGETSSRHILQSAP